ncbi:MAG: DsbA family protein [Alphaproteobacteria bacterium]|nr:DsbA family protein [Alphaproteobacteria bacterium]
MNFEQLIKTISASIAAVIVYILAAGFYLGAKGFVMGPDGVPVLVKEARANTQKINSNIVLPEGRILGDVSAPIAIYEFSSFGCYHCAEFHLNTLQQIKKEYINKGLVKLVFVPFPLEAKSMQATMIAECINNDKYFNFVDLMFKNQREWGLSRKSEDIILQYAKLNGLNEKQALSCMKNDEAAQEIIAKRQMAMDNFGIRGTPSFLIAYKNDREMRYGALSFDEVKQMVDTRIENKINKTAKK